MEFITAADWPIAIWIMLGVIIIGLPIESEIAQRIFKPAIEKGSPQARFNTYLYSIASLWGLALPILIIWQVEGLDWAALGFQWNWGLSLLGICVASGLIVAFFALQAWQMYSSAKQRRAYSEALRDSGGAHYFMPVTSRDHRVFLGLGVTAGITEEIIFRGFLIWVFSYVMPIWAAGLVSHFFFTLMHRYQGLSGMVQVFVIGAVITALYLIGGSLWPLIGLHIAVDVLNAITYRLGRLELEEMDDQDLPAPASEPC